jgi:SpoVK/Ycf46/Vps4 family AAA+-type ATPase
MGKNDKLESDFAQLAKLALNSSKEDVAFFVRRVARRIREGHPQLAAELEKLSPPPTRGVIARQALAHPPVDSDTRLQLIRAEYPTEMVEPIWSDDVRQRFQQIVAERSRGDDLAEIGLNPTRSALFVGPPGVGKTLSAYWLACALNLPLLTLDLSAVMSSFLGRTGGNLRNVMDYARGTPSVLLLDEFDAIAKRRDDITEIGELKRLVTVLLQEIDSWPHSGFLIAASNHEELLDPAVWRRFDTVLEFKRPEHSDIAMFVSRLFERENFDGAFLTAISRTLAGLSFSEIERELNQVKRRCLMDREPIAKVIGNMIRSRAERLPKKEQIRLAVDISRAGASQYQAEELTGVTRPTIRKHTLEEDRG